MIIFPVRLLCHYSSIDELNYFGQQDTIKDIQVLYNGRIWTNQHSRVKGDQFLFTPLFLKGSVFINRKEFRNVFLRYDIYNDELITLTPHNILLQLNKEMVDSFTLHFDNRDLKFLNMTENPRKELNGYVNVLYSGSNNLLVRYKKLIDLLAVERKYDEFYLVRKIYLEHDSTLNQISGKRKLLDLMKPYKQQVKSYIRKNGVTPKRGDPSSYIPAINYYESLTH